MNDNDKIKTNKEKIVVDKEKTINNKLFENEFFTILVAILIGFIVGAFVLQISGFSWIDSYKALFIGIFAKPSHIVQSVIAATPIIITGLSVVFAFKTGLFNIGAEGQFIVGSIAASFVGYYVVTLPGFSSLPNFIHPILVMVAAMLVGGLYGGIVGALKSRFGIHEVLSSIMFNWIAVYLNNFYIMESGFKSPKAEAVVEIQTSAMIKLFPALKKNAEGIKTITGWLEKNISNTNTRKSLEDVILRTDINVGIIIAIAVAIIVWIIINKTTLGYSLKAVGSNMDAAEFAGIDVKKNLFMSMAIAGAISGLAGAIYITGMRPHRLDILSTMENYGFNGLSVALIGAVNPIGTIFAGLFFGALNYGSTAIQTKVGAPTEIIDIVLGVIVFLIGVKAVFARIPEVLNQRRLTAELRKANNDKSEGGDL